MNLNATRGQEVGIFFAEGNSNVDTSGNVPAALAPRIHASMAVDPVIVNLTRRKEGARNRATDFEASRALNGNTAEDIARKRIDRRAATAMQITPKAKGDLNIAGRNAVLNHLLKGRKATTDALPGPSDPVERDRIGREASTIVENRREAN